jgi:hypothetical protein
LATGVAAADDDGLLVVLSLLLQAARAGAASRAVTARPANIIRGVLIEERM